MNHCGSDSGYVCQIVVDAWPVKKSQALPAVNTVPRCTMCRFYEVTRPVAQGQYLLRLPNRNVKNYSQDTIKLFFRTLYFVRTLPYCDIALLGV